MLYILLGAAGYLVGSIPFGYLVGRYVRGIDIREYGSGNIGTTNAFRVLGRGAGTIVFIGDMLKGLVPVWLGGLAGNPELSLVAGIAAVLGHNYSIFLGFKGGRGVATSAGAALGLVPLALVGSVVVWVVGVAGSRYVSLGSILAAISLPVFTLIGPYPVSYLVFSIIAAFLIIYGHRPNIRRLWAGKEPRLGGKKWRK